MLQFIQRNLFLVIGIALFILIGLTFLKKTLFHEEDATATTEKKFTVQTILSQAEEWPINLILNGITSPSQSVILTAEVMGNVEEILVQKGVIVEKGTPLFRISIENRQTDLDSATAALEHAKKNYESIKKLFDNGFRSDLALEEANSQYKQAVAKLAQVKRNVKNLLVRAPFDGAMSDIPIEVGSFVLVDPTYSPIATFVSLSPLKIVGYVDQLDYQSLHINQPVTLRLMNGETRQGHIVFISPVADPKTRTYRVEAITPNEDRLPAGMSAEMIIETKKTLAHRMNPAHVTLDDKGQLGVKIVTDGIVHFVPVTIIQSTSEDFFVNGLPETVELITVGQDFTIDGQHVLTQRVNAPNE